MVLPRRPLGEARHPHLGPQGDDDHRPWRGGAAAAASRPRPRLPHRHHAGLALPRHTGGRRLWRAHQPRRPGAEVLLCPVQPQQHLCDAPGDGGRPPRLGHPGGPLGQLGPRLWARGRGLRRGPRGIQALHVRRASQLVAADQRRASTIAGQRDAAPPLPLRFIPTKKERNWRKIQHVKHSFGCMKQIASCNCIQRPTSLIILRGQ
mmetsp:Transcript_41617/g.98672  ORF Transcript_41617/g.98672 Transcript_41617/m.98672 type:complete len:206 (+) Transcript_41617:972-1589(+)